MTEPEAGAARRYAESFGAAPAGVWQAPGRVNLIGEHTDYNDGFALPFAIGARVCVAAGPRPDGQLAVTSCQEGAGAVTVPVLSLEPGAVTGWAAYVAGVAWSMREAGYPVGGANLAVDASLQAGAGLSSSAALECSAALALAELYGISLPRADLAVLARRAENEFAGAPTGIMDQLAVLLCEKGQALLLDCRLRSGTGVPLDPAADGLALVVIDTHARHELTDGGYGSRRRACEDAARALGVRALRDVSDVAELDRLADPLLLRRARHIVTEDQRVLATVDLLRAGRLSAVGPLLTASHVSLRDDFEVSWPEADTTVEAACGAGALGARMTGGGFGGSVIALIPAGLAASVEDAVTSKLSAQGRPVPTFTPAVPSPSASRVW